MDSIKFLSSHGVVEAELGDCISLTFGMCRTRLPHAPVRKGVCGSITTMCNHDTGVVVNGQEPHSMAGSEQERIFMKNMKNDTTDKQPKNKLRVRKLTEGECYRLMGFEEKDTEACKAVGQSKANIYHQAGDSIVTTVLCGIFGTLLDLDYEKAIEKHSDKLHNECI